MSAGRIYLVTGANSGLGLEATRQILAAEPTSQVYMLCPSRDRAQKAIGEIGVADDASKNASFVRFDACDPASFLSSLDNDIPLLADGKTIDGILLNAGGFGDSKDGNQKITKTGTSETAQINLIAHAALVKHLIQKKKLTKGCRIIASGSEGCFFSKLDWAKANFKAHLAGDAPSGGPGLSYSWIKGILAFYWSAFARRYQDTYYVATISPGCTTDTNLFKHSGATSVVRIFSKLFSVCLGSHSVQVGAKLYVDALLDTKDYRDQNNNNEPPSGSFLAHRKGFTNDFGNVQALDKCVIFGEECLQDRAWDAVESFL